MVDEYPMFRDWGQVEFDNGTTGRRFEFYEAEGDGLIINIRAGDKIEELYNKRLFNDVTKEFLKIKREADIEIRRLENGQ